MTEWTSGDDVGGNQPEGSSSVQTSDRDVRIENQAAMHFASRIVTARMDYLGDRTEEAVVEELNKWMSKFKRGVGRGQIPKD